MKNIIYLSLIVLFSGCSIYKKYERPESVEAVADSLYRHTAEIEGDTAGIAALQWRELFTDPLLQRLIEKGMESNTDLGIAKLRVDAAKARLSTSRLSYLPSISLTPQGTVSKIESRSVTKSYEIAASANWEIDIFGKVTNAKREARALYEQSEAYRRAVETQLVATIANSYYTLLMLDRQKEITEQTVKNWEESVTAMNALKKAGQTTEMAVAQTMASKLSVEASLLSIKQQISETENSICALLGIPPQEIERASIEQQEFPESLSTGVPMQMLSRRPDIYESEAALAAAYYATNQARSAFYPSITLSGSAGWSNSAGGTISNPASFLASAIGSLVQPLFNRGQNIANLKIAKAQQEEALLSFRQKLLDAGNEVNDALTQWQTARGRMELSKAQVAALESALQNSELLMRYTSQNYLEVITARQSLLQAELDMVSSRFEQIQGVINLYHALGGGYSE